MKTPTRSQIPEAEVGLMAKISELTYCDGRHLDLGDVQRIVFLAQEALGVPTHYEFEFSPAGPSSSDLRADVDLAESLGAIMSQFDEKRDGAFVVLPASRANKYQAQAGELIRNAKEALDKIEDDFLKSGAESLELLTLIVFCTKRVPPNSTSGGIGVVRDIVKELRPRIRAEFIDQAITSLRDRGYLRT